MAEHSTLSIAASERMILFLVEKGVSVQFSDILDIWIWGKNPELAKKVIKIANPSDVQKCLESARFFCEDKSIYCYGGLEEGERNAFQKMLALLEVIGNT